VNSNIDHSFEYLDLSNNHLHGSILSLIFKQEYLEVLILASNNKLTGEISYSICILRIFLYFGHQDFLWFIFIFIFILYFIFYIFFNFILQYWTYCIFNFIIYFNLLSMKLSRFYNLSCEFEGLALLTWVNFFLSFLIIILFLNFIIQY
jgi:hypothetical protein